MIKTAMPEWADQALNRALDKVQANVPMDVQIKGMHLYQKARRRVLRKTPAQPMVETPLPPVESLPLEQILSLIHI